MLASPVAPQILQPIADSARTEAMLVAMATRRAINAGAPLGDLPVAAFEFLVLLNPQKQFAVALAFGHLGFERIGVTIQVVKKS